MVIFTYINKIKRFIGIASCFGLIGSLGACYDSGEPYPRRMEKNAKIEVKVESGGKIYSGYAIRNYQFSAAAGMFSDTDNFEERGEAVVVKVGDKGYLFLLRSFRPDFFVDISSPRDALSKLTSSNEAFPLRNLEKAPFVTFTDINDPRSVKEIFPRTYEDYRPVQENGGVVYENNKLKQENVTQKENVEEYFGDGAKILSVTITPTNEPVTWGQVDKVIPWIAGKGSSEFLFGPSSSSGALNKVEILQNIDFIWK